MSTMYRNRALVRNENRAYNKDWVETFYLPSLEGHYDFWKNRVTAEIQFRDRVICFGNLISLDEKQDNLQNQNDKLFGSVSTFARFSENWESLIGRNEIVALSRPDKGYLSYQNYDLLLDNWLSATSYLKVATESNGQLVTGGGLTYGEWVSIGRPQTASEAADFLNLKYMTTLYQGPSANLGNSPNYSANPIWADLVLELLPSWVTANESCPFDQVTCSVGGMASDGDIDAFSNPYSPAYFTDKVEKRKFGYRFTVKDAVFTDISNQSLFERSLDSKKEQKPYSGMYVERVARSEPLPPDPYED